MRYGLTDYVKAISQDRRRVRSTSNNLAAQAHLELTVERAVQGARRCRYCASVHDRYVCVPSAAVRNEWRHGDSGLELIVHLFSCQPDSGPRLQAIILVKHGSQSHARAVYSCELFDTELRDGPWTLRLISEKSECDFVFPGEIEIAASGTSPASRERALFDGR